LPRLLNSIPTNQYSANYLQNMAKRIKAAADLSTEEKIKEAARKVFQQKGYAATRTRDIAEEAGLNLALLNYYFRSKEKLFELVMAEKIQKLFSVVAVIMNDTENALEHKVELIVTNYVDMLLEHPDLPIFVLSEIRNHPHRFPGAVPMGELMRNSRFVAQLREERPDLHPMQLIFSILGMTVFPFIAGPVFEATGVIDKPVFNRMMEARKKLIPVWVKAILASG